MATAPILGSFTDVFTIGALATRIKRKVNEPMGPDRMADLYEDINDAIESIWMSALLCSLSKFTKGPVNQVIPANSTQLDVISTPDPTSSPTCSSQAGGNLAARTIYISYCLVTESGSTTKISPLTPLTLAPSFTAIAIPPSPTPQPDIIGFYFYAGNLADGSDQGLQSQNPAQSWYEPPAGLTPYPASSAPPASNTTGDNIFAIERLDVQNIDTTWTNWLQTNIGSSFFTEFGHKVSTTTTWQPFVYDLIDNRLLTYRPGPTYDLTATYFFVNKPRRLRFPQSRLPFTSFACHGFLFAQAMFLQTLGIYETDVSDRWGQYAQQERQRIMLQLTAGSQNRDTTVRPFMR